MATFVPLPSLVLALLAAAVGAFTDFRRGHIPNWLTLGTFLLGVALQGYFGESVGKGISIALLGAVVCGLVPLLLWYKDAMGGGDLKLFIALGAVLGPYHGIEAQFLSCCAAAVFAMAHMAWYGRLLRLMTNSLFLGINLVLPKRMRREIAPELLTKIRFGGGILAGTCIAALASFPYLYL